MIKGLPISLGLLLAACAADVAVQTESVSPAPTSISSINSGGELSLELIADRIGQPTALADAGEGRLFVAEQQGRIRVIDNEKLQVDPILDLTDRVLNDGERGLLGLALHPGFADNGRYFVMYSNLQGDTEVREYSIDDETDAEGALLLTVPQETVFHQGGDLQFGTDGYLYVSVGDDGRQENVRADPNSVLGTILRLDVTAPGQYAIPADNPFANGGGRPEIWDFGLRNPWRIYPDADGNLWIGDVGQNTAEELNLHRRGVPGGLDFGWSATEGTECRDADCNTDGITWPVVAYDHGNGDCGIIGGRTLNTAGTALFLYADLCSGRIWSVNAQDPGEPTLEIESGLRLSSFGHDQAGNVYVLAHYGNGSVYRVVGP